MGSLVISHRSLIHHFVGYFPSLKFRPDVNMILCMPCKFLQFLMLFGLLCPGTEGSYAMYHSITLALLYHGYTNRSDDDKC